MEHMRWSITERFVWLNSLHHWDRERGARVSPLVETWTQTSNTSETSNRGASAVFAAFGTAGTIGRHVVVGEFVLNMCKPINRRTYRPTVTRTDV